DARQSEGYRAEDVDYVGVECRKRRPDIDRRRHECHLGIEREGISTEAHHPRRCVAIGPSARCKQDALVPAGGKVIEQLRQRRDDAVDLGQEHFAEECDAHRLPSISPLLAAAPSTLLRAHMLAVERDWMDMNA